MKESDSSKQIRDILDQWNLSAEGAETLFGPTRDSLAEVSRLTTYLDEKAARVLTAVSFFGALAGTSYVGLQRDAPMQPPWLAFCFHLLFCAYCIPIAVGAFCVITGIFPRLNMPAGWSPVRTRNRNLAASAGQSGLPRSFHFAPQIIHSSPRDWAESFVDNDPAVLKSAYVKDHIHETYLVAEQIPYKLGWLWVGMRAIQIANLILVAWFTLTGARLIFGH